MVGTASRALGGFDFFGKTKRAPEEDMADVVGDEVVAHRAQPDAQRHRAGRHRQRALVLADQVLSLVAQVRAVHAEPRQSRQALPLSPQYIEVSPVRQRPPMQQPEGQEAAVHSASSSCV